MKKKEKSHPVILASIALLLILISSIELVATAQSASQVVTYAYITNSADNTVSVIDTSNNNVVDIVKVGSNPNGVAISPDGEKVYVTNEYSNTVSVINTNTNEVSATVKVGNNPTGVAITPDGTEVYVTNYIGNTVSVIDTATNKVTATISVQSSPWGVAVSPDGTEVYVTNDVSGTVSIISTSSNKVTGIVKAENQLPGGVAVTPDGKKVYATSGSSNTVFVIDTATKSVITTLNVESNPHGIAVSPDGTKVYLANFDSNTVSIIDTASDSVSSTVKVGNTPYGVAVSPDGTEVFVTNDHDNTVSIIDVATNTVRTVVKVGKDPKSLGKFIGVIHVNTDETPVYPKAEFSQSVKNGNAPLFVQFTDLSKNEAGWNWDFGDGTTSTEQNPLHTYFAAGTYTVSLVVRNGNGTDSKTDTINVIDGSSSNSGGSNSGSSSNSGGSSSGGSSSGGGAGGSPELQSNVEAKELSQIYVSSGKTVNFDFPRGTTPVSYVSFDSKKTAGKTTAIAEMLKAQSTLVSELPSDEIYKNLNIWVGNSGFATPENIENAVICFKVEKSWIKDKMIDTSSITLNSYSDNKWDQLPTSLSSEDDKYIYFTAETAGFSSFAITGKTTKQYGDTPIEKPESSSTEKTVVSSASVNLYGEKTDAVKGEDIQLKLSAVNLITKPTMHVQAIIIPPSGMSISSSEFVDSGAGQYTATFELAPGQGKDIEVRIAANQVGNFNVTGRVVYYFGENKNIAEDHTLLCPIHVDETDNQQTNLQIHNQVLPRTSGFEGVCLVFVLLMMSLIRKK